MPSRFRATVVGGLFVIIASTALGPLAAQSTKSAPLAKELVGLLQRSNLDTVAGKRPGSANRFAAAMLLGSTQLLVVSAEYSAPSLLEPLLDEKKYREVYIELQSASVPESKVFVADFSADGLAARPAEDGLAADTFEADGSRTLFDGRRSAGGLSEADYDSRFNEADAQYADILATLIAQLK